jgi:hypothetical protein
MMMGDRGGVCAAVCVALFWWMVTSATQLIAENAPPLGTKADFIRNYQGSFGSIKVSGCGFYNDNMFDPVVLLVTWTNNPRCFERAMQAHAVRGDNRVVVDPRAAYHGGQGGGTTDLWHDPVMFARFLKDVRAHVNNRGEHFKVLVFLAADGHIGSFLKNGQEGVPDPDAEAHFARDVRTLAAAAAEEIDGTAVCWECRPQRNYMTPGTYERNGKLIAELFPKAWHGQHLQENSSSWSSWNCDPASGDPVCTVANSGMEGDDPNRGQAAMAWIRCLRDGWCDGLLFEFETGDQYLNPAAHPTYTGLRGALGRYWEIVVRLGNDPRSIATAAGNRHGWPQADVLAFEFIYDAYNNRSDEAYGVAWCKQALAIGGWGCGSGSWRRAK